MEVTIIEESVSRLDSGVQVLKNRATKLETNVEELAKKNSNIMKMMSLTCNVTART